MTSGPSTQAIESSPQRIKRPFALSSRWMAFLIGWFFGWPLLIYAYNPLTAPYDPLTLFVVVPGGAIWLVAGALGCDALAKMAIERWPIAKTILKILIVLALLLTEFVILLTAAFFS